MGTMEMKELFWRRRDSRGQIRFRKKNSCTDQEYDLYDKYDFSYARWKTKKTIQKHFQAALPDLIYIPR